MPHYESRNEAHFCRECGERFEYFSLNHPSPHARTWVHALEKHDRTTHYEPCSRNCTDREQHEEKRAGRMLYGQGAKRPAYTSSERPAYDAIYPDKDEHS